MITLPWWVWLIVAVVGLAILGGVLSLLRKSAEGFKDVLKSVGFVIIAVTFPIWIIPWLVIKGKKRNSDNNGPKQ